MSVLMDKDFTEALPSEFDLFELPPHQTSVFQHYYDNVRPVSTITDLSPVEFLISNGGSDYIDLKQTRLHVKLKVIHADGTNLTKAEHCAPINLLLSSLWSQMQVYLQNQLVSSNNTLYAYKAYIQAMLYNGAEAKNTQLQSQLFYADSGTIDGDIDSTDTQTGINDGVIVRSHFIKESKSLTLEGPLYEDIFCMRRCLINNVNIGIKLFRNNAAFCLMSGVVGKEYKIELQDVYLKVCKLRMNNALILTHSKLLEKNNALYPYVSKTVTMGSIPSSQTMFQWDNLFQSNCPTRAVVAFVKAGAVGGSYTLNPFNFQSSNIKSVGLYLDGVSVPGRPLETDDVSTYVNLFDGFNTWREDTGNAISRMRFDLGCAFYVFNLEPLFTDGTYLNLIKSGNVRLEVHFKSALTQTLNVIVYSENPSLLEVDQTRNIFVK